MQVMVRSDEYRPSEQPVFVCITQVELWQAQVFRVRGKKERAKHRERERDRERERERERGKKRRKYWERRKGVV